MISLLLRERGRRREREGGSKRGGEENDFLYHFLKKGYRNKTKTIQQNEQLSTKSISKNK